MGSVNEKPIFEMQCKPVIVGYEDLDNKLFEEDEVISVEEMKENLDKTIEDHEAAMKPGPDASPEEWALYNQITSSGGGCVTNCTPIGTFPDFSVVANEVPLPASALIFATGVAALVAVSKKKRNR